MHAMHSSFFFIHEKHYEMEGESICSFALHMLYSGVCDLDGNFLFNSNARQFYFQLNIFPVCLLLTSTSLLNFLTILRLAIYCSFLLVQWFLFIGAVKYGESKTPNSPIVLCCI